MGEGRSELYPACGARLCRTRLDGNGTGIMVAGVLSVFTFFLGGFIFYSWVLGFLLVLGFEASMGSFASFVCLDSRGCFISELLVSL